MPSRGASTRPDRQESAHGGSPAARDELLLAVSHDLRGPISSLRLLTEALQDDVLEPDVRDRLLAQMAFHVDSLASLVDDLFEFSRAQAWDSQRGPRRLALENLVEQTIEGMHELARASGVRLASRLPASLPAVRAHPEPVRRVLVNLVENAVGHTPPGGAVTVVAEQHQTVVEVEIADTGTGIAGDERSHVFEPFFRGAEGPSPGTTGSGLGLSICRAIVEVLGGRIWLADSQEGTRVRFSLPLA